MHRRAVSANLPRRWPSIACLLLLASAGCNDFLGLGKSIDVDITVEKITGPDLHLPSDTAPSISCGFFLRAELAGSEPATWAGATVYWYAGVDRATPIDSFGISAAEVAESWGSQTIGPDQVQQTGWAMSAPIPFAVTFVYGYHRPRQEGYETTRVDASCGPEATDGPAPEISSLAIVPAGGALEPGDVLSVSYEASSEIGLWQTLVAISGPCEAQQLFFERLATEVSRTAQLEIPADCRLGIPLDVTVAALDVGIQDAVRTESSHISLVDETPPTVSVLHFPPSGAGTTTITGQYFVGDTIHLSLSAQDNHQLSAIVWEVAGDHNEIPVHDVWINMPLAIPVSEAWANAPLQLSIYAKDEAGLISDKVVSAPGALHVYPAGFGPVQWTTIEGEVRDVVFDQPRNQLYLIESNQRRILALSADDLAVAQGIDVGEFFGSVDMTPSGDSLVLTMPVSGALGIIDLLQPTRRVVTMPLALDTTLNQTPSGVRVASNGKAFVTLGGTGSAAFRLLEVDLESGDQRIRTDAGDNGFAGPAIARSYDRSTIVLNGGVGRFRRYDVITDSFGPGHSAIPYDGVPAVDGTGQYFALGVDVYGASLDFFLRVDTPWPTGGLLPSAFAPSGEYLYYAITDHIVRARVADGELINGIRNAFMAGLLRTSPDGSILVAVETLYSGTSKISLVRLQ